MHNTDWFSRYDTPAFVACYRFALETSDSIDTRVAPSRTDDTSRGRFPGSPHESDNTCFEAIVAKSLCCRFEIVAVFDHDADKPLAASAVLEDAHLIEGAAHVIWSAFHSTLILSFVAAARIRSLSTAACIFSMPISTARLTVLGSSWASAAKRRMSARDTSRFKTTTPKEKRRARAEERSCGTLKR